MGNLMDFLKKPENKKRFIIFSTVGLVIILLVLLFVFRPFSSLKQVDPLSIIPDNAAVIFKINNNNLFLENDSVLRLPSQLKEFSAINDFIKNLQLVDSIFNSLSSAKNVLNESSIYVSLHFSSSRPVSVLYIIESKENLSEINNDIIENSTLIFTEKEYESQEYLSFNNEEFFAYSYANLIVASFNELLLHSSITTCDNTNSFSKTENFKKSVEVASESADINVFMHLPFLYRMLGSVFSGETYSNLTFLTDFAGWGNIDISYNNNQMLLSGIFPDDDNKKSFINNFQEQTNNVFSIERHLPGNTSSAQGFAFSSFQIFFSSYENYLNSNGNVFNASEEQYLFSEKAGSESLADLFLHHTGNAFVLFSCPGTQSVEPDVFCAIAVNDSKRFIEEMHDEMKNSSKKRQWDSLNYRGIPVFSIPVQYGAYSLYGPFFNNIEKTYVAICDSVMYIGSSVSSLKNMLNNVLSGRTLYGAEHYKSLQSGLNSSWHTFSYLNINNAAFSLNNQWVEDSSLIASINSLKQKENGIIMALTSSKESQGILISGCLVFGKTEGSENAGWFTSLDAKIETGPIVLRSSSQNKYWIIASDVYENVYLLNDKGQIEWKNSIEGRPNNDYALLFANSSEKNAVIFSTEKYLYMINLNGKSDRAFPVKIDYGIAGKILITDYDKNNKYRIIFSDRNGKILNYNTKGNATDGWKNPKIDLQYDNSLFYRRLNGKDYIIVVQSDHSAWILNRRGEKLNKVENVWFNKACNTFFVDEEHNCFIASDIDGSLITISSEGDAEIMIPGSFSEDYIFTTLGEDYIFFDEGVMYVMNINGDIIEKKDVSESSLISIRTFIINTHNYIGFRNHNGDMGLIGAGNNVFINDDSYSFSYYDLVNDKKKTFLIKGYEKTISAEILEEEIL